MVKPIIQCLNALLCIIALYVNGADSEHKQYGTFTSSSRNTHSPLFKNGFKDKREERNWLKKSHAQQDEEQQHTARLFLLQYPIPLDNADLFDQVTLKNPIMAYTPFSRILIPCGVKIRNPKLLEQVQAVHNYCGQFSQNIPIIVLCATKKLPSLGYKWYRDFHKKGHKKVYLIETDDHPDENYSSLDTTRTLEKIIKLRAILKKEKPVFPQKAPAYPDPPCPNLDVACGHNIQQEVDAVDVTRLQPSIQEIERKIKAHQQFDRHRHCICTIIDLISCGALLYAAHARLNQGY